MDGWEMTFYPQPNQKETVCCNCFLHWDIERKRCTQHLK